MKSIWKFPLEGFECNVEMPTGAKILHVATQGDEPKPYVWALVDPDAPKVRRTLTIVGTGWKLKDHMGSMPYVGTFMLLGGSMVWHVFDHGEGTGETKDG
jgi:hypothetical protein